MFSKAALLAIVSSAALAVATPLEVRGGPGGSSTTLNQCNTGDASCCNNVQKAGDPNTAQLLGLLGVVVQGVDVLIGISCTPIVSVVDLTNCAQQPVCCTNNNFNGLVNVGCTPISL